MPVVLNQAAASLSTVAPQILDPPDDLTVVEPQNATFSCQATGRPRPTIVWTRLSDMVQLQNQSGVYRIEEQEIGDRERRSMLTIVGTQPSDAGAYACVALNEPGNATQQATLTVHGESVFEHLPMCVCTVSDYVCLFVSFSGTQYHLPSGWSGVHCQRDIPSDLHLLSHWYPST